MVFHNISSTLTTYSQQPLPTGAVELIAQPQHEYTRIFQAITNDEQKAINACRQKAGDACRKLRKLQPEQPEKATKLCNIAISNLVKIRQRQHIFAYFEGADDRFPLDNFRDRVRQANDFDALKVAMQYKNELTCPYQRLNLFYFLQRAFPEHRESAAPHIVALLVRFIQADQIEGIFRVMAHIPKVDKGPFLEQLDLFCSSLPEDRWEAIEPILTPLPTKKRRLYLEQTLSLLPKEIHIDSKEVRSTLKAVSILKNGDDVVQLSRPLTERCLDGNYIAAIVRYVDRMNPDERQDVVERVLPLMLDASAGILLYETARKLTGLHVKQRNWVQREIEAMLGNYSREDADQTLELLDQVEPPPSLEHIERMEVVIPDENLDCYRMEICRDELYTSPSQILLNLVELFQKEEKSSLQITFLGEAAVDKGGPGQEFVSILIDQVCKKLKMDRRMENGLYRPSKSDLSQEEKQLYGALGQLFRFLLNSRQKYVIGQFFDMSLFVALHKLSDETLTDFEIYEQMEREFDPNKVALQRMKQAPQEDVDETIKGFLEPCKAIKAGMQDSPFTAITEETQDPQTLFLDLQGSIKNSFVVAQIEFKAGVSPLHQQWIQEWILGLDAQKMKTFIFSLTGGFALGQKKLFVSNHTDKVLYNTCDTCLEVPFHAIPTKELLIKLLEGDFVKFNHV